MRERLAMLVESLMTSNASVRPSSRRISASSKMPPSTSRTRAAEPANGVAARRRAAGSAKARATRLREDRLLLQRYHQDGDTAAREELVERFLPLARQLARRYKGGSEPLDDLVQVASVGLLKAIDRFDPSRSTAFSSFAVPTIVGELKRHFRDRSWSVHVPRDLQELTIRVERVADELLGQLGRAPTAAEVAEHLSLTPEQVVEAREAAGAYRAVSLDRPADGDEGEARHRLVKAMGAEDPGYRIAEAAATIEPLMRELPRREREILRLRFQEDLTQTEIGARVGVSQMHVSRVIRQAITRLRAAAAAPPGRREYTDG
jgi:RNA polymerase sigma-B factor